MAAAVAASQTALAQHERVRVPPCRNHLKARFARSRSMPATPCRAAAVPSAPGGPRPQRSRVASIVLRNNNKDVITIFFYPKRARVTKSAPSHSALKPVQTAVQRPNMVSRCGQRVVVLTGGGECSARHTYIDPETEKYKPVLCERDCCGSAFLYLVVFFRLYFG